jgi:hypothetical protein
MRGLGLAISRALGAGGYREARHGLTCRSPARAGGLRRRPKGATLSPARCSRRSRSRAAGAEAASRRLAGRWWA